MKPEHFVLYINVSCICIGFFKKRNSAAFSLKHTFSIVLSCSGFLVCSGKFVNSSLYLINNCWYHHPCHQLDLHSGLIHCSDQSATCYVKKPNIISFYQQSLIKLIKAALQSLAKIDNIIYCAGNSRHFSTRTLTYKAGENIGL